MLCCERIDISKGIDLAKSNRSKEYMICNCCFLIMDSTLKILYAKVATI